MRANVYVYRISDGKQLCDIKLEGQGQRSLAIGARGNIVVAEITKLSVFDCTGKRLCSVTEPDCRFAPLLACDHRRQELFAVVCPERTGSHRLDCEQVEDSVVVFDARDLKRLRMLNLGPTGATSLSFDYPNDCLRVVQHQQMFAMNRLDSAIAVPKLAPIDVSTDALSSSTLVASNGWFAYGTEAGDDRRGALTLTDLAKNATDANELKLQPEPGDRGFEVVALAATETRVLVAVTRRREDAVQVLVYE